MRWLPVIAVLALIATQSAAPGSIPIQRSGFASRGGVDPIDLPQLTAESQFIWKGGITAVAAGQSESVPYDGGTVLATVQTVTLRVDAAIKGAAPKSHLVRFDLYQGVGRGPLWGHFGGPFAAGWYGLVFLTATGDRLVPTDLVYPGIQVSPTRAATSAKADALSRVEAELINTLRDTRHARVQSAAEQLVQLRLGAAIPALGRLTNRRDPVLAGTGYGALLRLRDRSRLAGAVKFVNRYGPPPGTPPAAGYASTDSVEWVRAYILGAFHDLDSDEAVPLLNPLALSTDPLVRQNVVPALRRIANPSSMPYLAAVLDDPDPAVSMDAMYGLADAYQRMHWSASQWQEYRESGGGSGSDFVEAWPAGMLPDWDAMQADPGKYRRFWKNWWETKGKQAQASWMLSHPSGATP